MPAKCGTVVPEDCNKCAACRREREHLLAEIEAALRQAGRITDAVMPGLRNSPLWHLRNVHSRWTGAKFVY